MKRKWDVVLLYDIPFWQVKKEGWMVKERKQSFKWGKYLIVIGIIILMFLFFQSVERKPLLADDHMVFVKAVVVQNDHEVQQAQASLDSGDTQEIVLKIKSGSHKGETVDAYSLNGYLYGADCKVGTKVIASLSEYDGELSANVYNYDRELEIGLLLAVFFGLMWLIGGKKGFNSIIALIFTFCVVIMLYIPMMYIGISPLCVRYGVSGDYHICHFCPDCGFSDEIDRSYAGHNFWCNCFRSDRTFIRSFRTCDRL